METINPISGIYKITSPSGKVYIGQSINILKRWGKYKGLHCKGQTYIFNSFQKYGVENHTFSIIEECIEDQLNEREIYWTLHYNALYPNGLVLKAGGHHGYMSDYTKQKMSISHTGRKFTQEHIQNKKIPNVFIRKPIIQYDLEMNIIREWNSIKEAALGINTNSNYNTCKSSIQACCAQKRQKSAFGYIWKYKTIK
jgi:hypothetical protein